MKVEKRGWRSKALTAAAEKTTNLRVPALGRAPLAEAGPAPARLLSCLIPCFHPSVDDADGAQWLDEGFEMNRLADVVLEV